MTKAFSLVRCASPALRSMLKASCVQGLTKTLDVLSYQSNKLDLIKK